MCFLTTVGDISQCDVVSRVQKTVRVGWYTRSRSLSSDRTIQRFRAFKL